MVLNTTIVINLAEFGGEGFVEMGYPSLRRQRAAEREAAAILISGELDKNGKPKMQMEYSLEAGLITMLSYVESAPFELSIDGFYDFTDQLDKKYRGSGAKLLEKLMDTMEKIKNGDTSPSAGSQGAETVSSA